SATSRRSPDTRCPARGSGSPSGRRSTRAPPSALLHVLAHVFLGRRQLERDALAHELLERLVVQALDDLLEVALDEDANRVAAWDATGHHVEDLVLVDLADGAAVRGLDVVRLDDQ